MGSSKPSTGFHVLLVEDNKGDAELLLSLFQESDVSITFQWAKSGEEALAYLFGGANVACAGKVDTVLLDLKLPGISGFEVLERIRKDPATATLPVIILTSSSLPQDARRCREYGANEFIRKPDDLVEFEALVARLAKEILPRFL